MLDALREQYTDVFANNFKKWSVGRWWLNYQKVPYKTYDENFNFLKSWCRERNEWLTEYYGIVPNAPLLGDADMDREVTVIDVTCIQRRLAGVPLSVAINEAVCDIDGNGVIEISDATFIQRYVGRIPVSYPIGAPITE